MSTDYAGRSVDALNHIFDGMMSNLEHKWKREAMILNDAQVIAVYNSMCAMNNVFGVAKMMMRNNDGTVSNVKEDHQTGRVTVVKKKGDEVLHTENFSNQNTFAKAYGLDD